MKYFVYIGLIFICFPAFSQEFEIVVDTNSDGLVFEGIGAVSAGASSRLLIDYPEPYTQFGSMEYGDYEVSADVKTGKAGTAKVFGRVSWFESNTAPHGVGLELDADGNWRLTVDRKTVKSGTEKIETDRWHNLKLVFDGQKVEAFLDQKLLTSFLLEEKHSHGLAGIGCNWQKVRFDNLSFSAFSEK